MPRNRRAQPPGTRYRPDVGRELIATRAELIAAGVAPSTISHRTGPAERWQRLLPGVVVMHRGTPTSRERLLGALAYAGPDSMVTGLAALELHGLRTAREAGARGERRIQTLVPAVRRRQSHGFTLVERCTQLPVAVDIRGIRTAPLARALVDACRRTEHVADVRDLVSDALQNARLPLADLIAAVGAAARQRTAPIRAVLVEMDAGVRFAAEARARELIRAANLPEPLYNATVLDAEGNLIAKPDGYYPQWACGYQIDSRRWHLSPADYERTADIRARAAAFGVMLAPVTPTQIFEQPQMFSRALVGLIGAHQHRTDLPDVLVREA